MRKLSRRASQMSAKINQNIASPTDPQATLDQLDDACLGELFSEVKVGVQREFLGEDWTRLLRSDIVRYLRHEKMSVLNKDGGVMVEGGGRASASGSATVVPANLARMCWVEPSATLTEQYAGLAEVILQLHALPFELNCKLKNFCCAPKRGPQTEVNLHVNMFHFTYTVHMPLVSTYLLRIYVKSLLIFPSMFLPMIDCVTVKAGAATPLRLLEPAKGCTMLLHYPQGASQMARIDSRDDGSDLDSGIRCVMFEIYFSLHSVLECWFAYLCAIVRVC